MAAREPKPEESKSECDNHAGVDAVFVSDGGGKHQPIRLCKPCLARMERAQVPRRGGIRVG